MMPSVILGTVFMLLVCIKWRTVLNFVLLTACMIAGVGLIMELVFQSFVRGW